MPAAKARSDARGRILETAEKLFYAEGYRAVGIDRIIAEAGVAKMTLYKHFPAKDDLVLEVLKSRDKKLCQAFADAIARYRNAGAQPLAAFFAALKEWFSSDDFRGCAFINAAVEFTDPEHPVSEFARFHKREFFKLIHQAVVDDGAPEAIAPAVGLLVEGAIVAALMNQDPASADVARDAAVAMASGAVS